jgi:co-chaperonin GroES (HSP10)
MKPFNDRILIKEIKKKDVSMGGFFMPEEVKDRTKLSKFLQVTILDVAPNIEEKYSYLKGKQAVIETGFLEEVLVNGKMFRFSPVSYIVGILDEEDFKKD